jgi:hypothetical protein
LAAGFEAYPVSQKNLFPPWPFVYRKKFLQNWSAEHRLGSLGKSITSRRGGARRSKRRQQERGRPAHGFPGLANAGEPPALFLRDFRWN